MPPRRTRLLIFDAKWGSYFTAIAKLVRGASPKIVISSLTFSNRARTYADSLCFKKWISFSNEMVRQMTKMKMPVVEMGFWRTMSPLVYKFPKPPPPIVLNVLNFLNVFFFLGVVIDERKNSLLFLNFIDSIGQTVALY